LEVTRLRSSQASLKVEQVCCFSKRRRSRRRGGREARQRRGRAIETRASLNGDGSLLPPLSPGAPTISLPRPSRARNHNPTTSSTGSPAPTRVEPGAWLVVFTPLRGFPRVNARRQDRVRNTPRKNRPGSSPWFPRFPRGRRAPVASWVAGLQLGSGGSTDRQASARAAAAALGSQLGTTRWGTGV